jgi:hypothetical protein
MELIHLPALSHLVSFLFPFFFVCRLPQPIPLPIARSQNFHPALGTTQQSDY